MSRIASTLLALFSFALLTSCAETNIRHDMRVGTIPNTMEYTGGKGRVWQAVIGALSEKEIVKTINESGGLVATDYRTVEGRELEPIKTALLATTYKYSFSINVQGQSTKRTKVKVKVNLLAQQVGFYSREIRDQGVENYLKKDLFSRICSNLSPGNPKGCGMNLKIETPKQQYSTTQKTTGGDPKVKKVQENLIANGYNPGKPDGLMGKKTRRAIRQFQRDNNFAVTGKMDAETLAALGVKGHHPPPAMVAKSSEKSQKKKANTKQKQSAASSQNKTVTQPTPQQDSGAKASEDHYYITLSPTVLKKSPKIMAEKITEIPENTVLSVVKEMDSWLEVTHRGKTGFVYSSLVAKKNGKKPAPQTQEKAIQQQTQKTKGEEKTTQAAKTSEEISHKAPTTALNKPEEIKPQKAVAIGSGIINNKTYLLKRSSVMSGKIMPLTKGTKVQILAENKSFYKIVHNAKEGFVYMDFITME